MASEDTAALIDSLNIINAQQQMAAAGAATGNPRTKGVVVDSKSGSKANKAKAVSATLTSNEKSRYENIFKILKDVIDPDPEAGKSSTTSRAKKEVSVSDPAKVAAGGDAEKEGSSFIDKLLGGLGIIGFAKTIFGFLKKKLFSLLKKMGKFLKDALRRGLKAAKNLLKSVGKAALKQLKRLGRWAGKLFTGLMNSKPMMALKGAIGAAFTRLKDVFTGAKNALMKHVGKLKNLIKPAAAAATGAGVGGAVDSRLPARYQPPKPAAPKPAASSSWLSKATNFGKGALKSTVNAAKATGGLLGSAVKATGGVLGGAATSVAKGTVRLGKDAVNLGKGVARTAGNVAKFAMNPKEGIKKAKATLKAAIKKGGKVGLRTLFKIPVLGSVIETAFAAYDINNFAKDPELGEEDLKQSIGKRVIEGVTGVLGGAGAAAIVGVLTGGAGFGASVLSYMAGDMLGRFVGGLLADTFGAKPIGSLILNTFPNLVPPEVAALRAGQATGIDDGIITHGGQTVRINSKDDILALKTGGPLDKLMKPSSLDIGSAQVFDDMRELGKAQLQTLVAIKNGINALVAKGGQDSSSPSKIDLSPNKLSDAFFKSEQYT